MPKALVIRGGAIGDFILTLPAIRLLKEGLPGLEVELLAYKPMAELAIQAGLVKSARSIEHAALSSFFIPGAQLNEEWSQWFSSFNLVISYVHDIGLCFVNHLKICGVKTIFEGPYRPSDEGEPAALQLAKPLEKLALYVEHPYPELTFPHLKPHLLEESSDCEWIAWHPGSGGRSKIWPLARWIETLRSLFQQEKQKARKILLIIGEAEVDSGLAQEAKLALHDAGIPFQAAEMLTLQEVAVELSQCRLFLGHDSGMTHLAAAVGVPCRVLFGPTNPKVWAPQSPETQVMTRMSDRNSQEVVDWILSTWPLENSLKA